MEILGYDYDAIANDGQDNITTALLTILNEYPALMAGEKITFQSLSASGGIAMFANPAVAILTENESVTGHVRQTCAYAFTVVYRTKITNRQYVKEWLDNLGRWIEKQELPLLTDGREFLKIARQTQGYLYNTTDDKAEDWAISLQATYRHEFDR